MDFSSLHVKEIRGVVRYASGARDWNAVNRTDHIVGIKLSGSARHEFSEHSFVLSRDCIFFINQRDEYHVEVYEPGESFSFHFTTYEEIDTESFCVPVSNTGKLISILQKAEIASDTGDSLQLSSLLYQFASELWRTRSKSYSKRDVRVSTAKEYMDLHFKECDCLKNAIRESGLGERRFGTLFKNGYDTTPNKYITFCRIEHAKRLLSAASIPVSEVASLCGFSDVYYFSKVFKSETGIPPSKWK